MLLSRLLLLNKLLFDNFVLLLKLGVSVFERLLMLELGIGILLLLVVIVGLVVGVLLGLLLCFSSYMIRLLINNSDRIVEFIIRFRGLVSVFKKEDCFFVLCCVCLVLIMLSNFC